MRDELGAGGPPGQSVLEAAQHATGLTPNKARALLGRFLFSGEEAEKPLHGLSGGERRRLSLAMLVQSRRQRADPRRAHQPPGQNRSVFSVQYHPEAAPGPHDAADHFDQFCALLHQGRG